MRANPELSRNNGFLGGFVGLAALIGRYDEAFANHNRNLDWGYDRCRVPVQRGQECPRGQNQRLTFPDFLTPFLPQDAPSRRSREPGTSEPSAPRPSLLD